MYERVNQNLSQPCETASGWDKLIAEAQSQIGDLERAIEHFKQNKEKGEPYFGELGVRFQTSESGSVGKGATEPTIQ